MKKLLLILMLAAVSSSAMAEWVEIGVDTKKYIDYVDPETIRKSGNKVKMWEMTDFKTVQELDGKQFMSTKVLKEYDCKEGQSRQLYLSVYSENMGRGNTIISGDRSEDKWKPTTPGTVGEGLWQFACRKWRGRSFTMTLSFILI